MNKIRTTDPTAFGGPEFEASRRLWPDPFEAPGVPPPDVLLRLAEHPEEDIDLVAQVCGSLEARRALFTALAAWNFSALSPRDKPLRPIAMGLRLSGADEAPVFGEIWHSSAVVEHYDGERIAPRRTWSPPMALVVSEPQDTGFDTICRAVFCSVRELCDEEILECGGTSLFCDSAGYEYVAHLGLEYPVSCSQLAVRVGVVDPSGLAPLQESMAAHQSDAPHPRLNGAKALSTYGSAVFLRLAAQAAWLSANADARLAHRESDAEADEQMEDVFGGWDTVSNCLLPLEEALPMAAAGGGQRWTTLLTVHGSLKNLKASLQAADGPPARRAALNDYPVARDDGSASGQWEIKEGEIPEDGCEFFLIHRQSGAVLGAGHAMADGILELDDGDQPGIDAAGEGDFLLVLALSPKPPEQ